jgi:8-oxo-dGTP diphosphatase
MERSMPPDGAAPLARFVAFHEISEEDPAALGPLHFAVMLAHAPGGVILVFNRYRKVWELPGGLIDPGDTPRECARRELLEEAGCEAGEMWWLGVVEVNDGRRHLGAVYACRLDAVPGSFESDETSGIALWTAAGAPQPLGNGDAALLSRFGATLAKSPG